MKLACRYTGSWHVRRDGGWQRRQRAVGRRCLRSCDPDRKSATQRARALLRSASRRRGRSSGWSTEIADRGGAFVMLRGPAAGAVPLAPAGRAHGERPRHVRPDGDAARTREADLPFAGLAPPPGARCSRASTSFPSRAPARSRSRSAGRPGARPHAFRLAFAVLDLLAAAAADAPVVVIVDDMHRLDRASADVLCIVARWLEPNRRVVVTARRAAPRRRGTLAGDDLEQLKLGTFSRPARAGGRRCRRTLALVRASSAERSQADARRSNAPAASVDAMSRAAGRTRRRPTTGRRDPRARPDPRGVAVDSAGRRPLLVSKGWVQMVILVILFGFFVLGLLAYRTYQAKPPVPLRTVTRQAACSTRPPTSPRASRCSCTTA